MPAFHACKAIFVHVPKTGGKNISRSVLRPYKPDDQTWQAGHASIFEQLEMLGGGFDNYFKFAFVRNPWDRLVSAYHHLKQRPNHRTLLGRYQSFAEFAAGLSARPEDFFQVPHFRPQVSFLCRDDGYTPLDYIGRFENYAGDLQFVLQQLSISVSSVGQRNRSYHANYRKCYDKRLRDAVGEVYAKDIEKFGYSFNHGREETWRERLMLRFGRTPVCSNNQLVSE